MRKIVLAVLLSFTVVMALAEETPAPTATGSSNDPMFPMYILMGLIVVVMLLILATGVLMIRIMNMLAHQTELDKAKRLGLAYVQRPGWWSRLSQRANAYVPIEDERSIEMEHSYDGIKELDNHLPPWWKGLFYSTIVWSVVYLFMYHVSDYPLMIQEYDNEISQADEQLRKLKASQPQEAIDETTLTYSADVTIIGKGKEVFNTMNCGSCHRPDGGGNAIGPNLTDEFWLHGGDLKEVFTTIKNGVVEKGMPAWGKSLSPQDVRNVAFYVMSLQGTNPPNPKAPQGLKHIPVAPVAKDSTLAQVALPR